MKTMLWTLSRVGKGATLGAALVVLWLAGGCGVTGVSSESETHFLASCDDKCEDGLECVCGVCTRTCDASDSCRDLSEQASCQASGDDGCESRPEQICDVGCSDDEECGALGAGYTCESGSCRRVTSLSASTNDNVAGSGGTGAGGTTGSGNGAGGTAAGGGGVEPPPPRGNLQYQMTGCTSYSAAVGPDANASTDVKLTQMPSLDGTEVGRRIEDGQEGAYISCVVATGSPDRIEASIRGIQSHPSAQFVETVGIDIEDAWIQQMDSGGAGEAKITVYTGGVSYHPEDGTVCTLSLESTRADSQFTVDTGRAYVRFDCPSLTDPPTTGCRVSGAFVLERCGESL